MKTTYLDNAATTQPDKEVVELMYQTLNTQFGNPSSTHNLGRNVKVLIEESRKKIASLINSDPSEIYFTSGGTEADNTIINRSIYCLGVKHIITSKLEHHAVLDTCIKNCEEKKIKLSLVKNNNKGEINLKDLEILLSENKDKKTLVSLIHGNNEIGTVIPIKKINAICKQYNTLFHSDTVQTIGHFPFNLKELDIDFITCSAHKLHGAKGVGFFYMNKKNKITSFIHGGAQERATRAGTENVYGIIGMAKALEIAYNNIENHKKHIQGLKQYMITRLKEVFKSKNMSVEFNGDISGNSLYTVLNVKFPETNISEMFLYYLDMKGICASTGSACSSGANSQSHVLEAINCEKSHPSIRFSFSKFNMKSDIDCVIDCIKEIYKIQ